MTFALHCVKDLYTQGLYLDCIDRCEALLKTAKVFMPKPSHLLGRQKLTASEFQRHRLYRVFLHFYAGTCHEALSDALGDANPCKAEKLRAAKLHFAMGADMLPSLQGGKTKDVANGMGQGASTQEEQALKHYDNLLRELRSLLNYHERWVQNRLEEINLFQSHAEEDSKAALQRRIAEGRARCWLRQRYNPARTREIVHATLEREKAQEEGKPFQL